MSKLTCVREIASFGSFATGTADEWSDLDLLVACEEPEKTAWRAAGAIRASKRVAFYRMFTGVSQPSGRYWFCDESPFLRLDVSFHSMAGHAGVLKNGERAGHPIQVRCEYRAESTADLAADAGIYPAVSELSITERESEVGRLLYNHLEALKHFLRDRSWKRNPSETRAELLAAIATPLVAGGGDLEGLIARVEEFTRKYRRARGPCADR